MLSFDTFGSYIYIYKIKNKNLDITLKKLVFPKIKFLCATQIMDQPKNLPKTHPRLIVMIRKKCQAPYDLVTSNSLRNMK